MPKEKHGAFPKKWCKRSAGRVFKSHPRLFLATSLAVSISKNKDLWA